MTMATKAVIATFIFRQPDELAGSDVAKATGLASGALYPILRRLEERGVLSSRWENIIPSKEGRPQKRLYKFTEDGLTWALFMAQVAAKREAKGK